MIRYESTTCKRKGRESDSTVMEPAATDEAPNVAQVARPPIRRLLPIEYVDGNGGRDPGSRTGLRVGSRDASAGQQVADAGMVADGAEGRVVAQAVALLVVKVAEAGLERGDQ